MIIKSLLIIIAFLSINNIFAQNTLDKLGPNGKLFLKIREIWMKKESKHLLPYLEQRTRIAFVNFSEQTPKVYFPEHAIGIIKKHFSEVNIKKFDYIREKMEENKGVAIYQYQIISSGIENCTLLYIQLNLNKNTWLISTITEVNIQEK